jgi:hypothetical protein
MELEVLLDKTDREADDVAADDEREELLEEMVVETDTDPVDVLESMLVDKLDETEELVERRGALVYSESRSPAPEATISIGRHFTEIY